MYTSFRILKKLNRDGLDMLANQEKNLNVLNLYYRQDSEVNNCLNYSMLNKHIKE